MELVDRKRGGLLSGLERRSLPVNGFVDYRSLAGLKRVSVFAEQAGPFYPAMSSGATM